MSKKLTYEFVKNKFIEKGCIPKFTEYISSSTKLDYVCSNGHEHSITWDNFKQGHGCYHCFGNPIITIDFIRNEFENVGSELLSKEYKNAKTKLDYICNNGHRHNITWDNWKKGRRCAYCYGKSKPTYKFIKSKFEEDGCVPKFTEYINTHTKLDYICPNGHEHSITWNNFKQGYRCSYCACNAKLNYDDIKNDFIQKRCIPKFTEYVNNRTKLDYICHNGHEHSITWADWSQNKGCPKCANNGPSKFEQEIKDFILSLNQQIIENDRSTIINYNTDRHLELDILFPCKTKAIECNGVYWHSKERAKIKDKIKQDQCKELGINLLVITDEDWYNNQEKCKKLIEDFIIQK